MPISMLKYIKVLKTLRRVSISTDHHQGVCLYHVKVNELFKKLSLKSWRSFPVLWQQNV